MCNTPKTNSRKNSFSKTIIEDWGYGVTRIISCKVVSWLNQRLQNSHGWHKETKSQCDQTTRLCIVCATWWNLVKPLISVPLSLLVLFFVFPFVKWWQSEYFRVLRKDQKHSHHWHACVYNNDFNQLKQRGSSRLVLALFFPLSPQTKLPLKRKKERRKKLWSQGISHRMTGTPN